MKWKQTLGKPGEEYIIGKRWLKKHIPKKYRVSKVNHKESCPGAIYDLGKRYLPNAEKMQHIWICMETGQIITKTPSTIAVPKPKPRKEKPIVVPKPKTKVTPAKEVVKPKVEPKPEPEPEIEVKPVTKPSPKFTKETSVQEVKGIGKAAFEKLSAAGINTIDDLLGKHSQEIATLIGRKSDAQIKTWQDNALAMLE
jgi:predicted flap endonuclease-1-like 5' DNA nuclease